MGDDTAENTHIGTSNGTAGPTFATRVVGVADLATIVDHVGADELLDQLIERLAGAFRRHDEDITVTFDRAGFHYRKPDLGLLEWMPAMEVGRRVVIKTVGYHPSNPAQRSLPSVLATTTLFDTETGRMLAISESTVLTALRTGAASAVATDVLARPDATTLGVIGCGAQAVTQVHAISRVRPIERVLALDPDAAVADSLARRLAFTGLDIEVIPPERSADLVANVDILCTCTSVDPGAGPVFQDGDHRPWLHINAVGADFAEKVEVPKSLLERALVCPDVFSQCVIEGECQQLDRANIGPSLASVVREQQRYRSAADGLTVFDSTGWSLEDLVVLELVLEHADSLGVGTTVDLQATAEDPYDPYGALHASTRR